MEVSQMIRIGLRGVERRPVLSRVLLSLIVGIPLVAGSQGCNRAVEYGDEPAWVVAGPPYGARSLVHTSVSADTDPKTAARLIYGQIWEEIPGHNISGPDNGSALEMSTDEKVNLLNDFGEDPAVVEAFTISQRPQSDQDYWDVMEPTGWMLAVVGNESRSASFWLARIDGRATWSWTHYSEGPAAMFHWSDAVRVIDGVPLDDDAEVRMIVFEGHREFIFARTVQQEIVAAMAGGSRVVFADTQEWVQPGELFAGGRILDNLASP